MAEQNGIYKCNICGNVVEVLDAHDGELVCCGEPMEMLIAKTSAHEGKEKHVPVLKIAGGKVAVNVGSVDHPMEQKHYIAMIQLLKNNSVVAEKRLKPGEKPFAEFCIADAAGLKARAWCNIHGLWVD
ncbi:MAG: desulfoferrodoxin [Candidatus Woesearchaeota archaeon]